MKYIICDITGRTINYDIALCEAIHNELPNDSKLYFWCSKLSTKYPFKTHYFFSLVPGKYKTENKFNIRILKALNTIFAYIWIIFYMLFHRVDVFHLQWFPFLSLGLFGSTIDFVFMKLLRLISPKTKFIFTIHNVAPHSIEKKSIYSYNKVFSKVLTCFDKYVVHTESTRDYVVSNFGLIKSNVYVIYHGIFNPSDYTFSQINTNLDKIKIIMYGFQSYYKGTDILVKALSLVKEEYKNKIEVSICGAFSDSYYKDCTSIDTKVKIKWIPRFLSDKELYDNIDASNVIVLPYRKISQSGVLLLALNTKRYIITSDLPSFKETLSGFPEDNFFKSEDAKDLARVINSYCEKTIDFQRIQQSIEKLNILYSWKQSAIKTIHIYNN